VAQTQVAVVATAARITVRADQESLSYDINQENINGNTTKYHN
jgi:hypothetical protein